MRTASHKTAFAKAVAAFTASAANAATTTARNTAARLAETIVNATPVRTGQARAGWMPSTGSTASASPGSDPLDRLKTLGWNPETGEPFFFTNTVPHIRFLEYGGSASAPSGMVRLAAASFKTIAAEEAARAKHNARAATRSTS